MQRSYIGDGDWFLPKTPSVQLEENTQFMSEPVQEDRIKTSDAVIRRLSSVMFHTEFTLYINLILR